MVELDIYDMVDRVYPEYGGTSISRIWQNYDIYDMVELEYLGYG